MWSMLVSDYITITMTVCCGLAGLLKYKNNMKFKKKGLQVKRVCAPFSPPPPPTSVRKAIHHYVAITVVIRHSGCYQQWLVLKPNGSYSHISVEHVANLQTGGGAEQHSGVTRFDMLTKG